MSKLPSSSLSLFAVVALGLLAGCSGGSASSSRSAALTFHAAATDTTAAAPADVLVVPLAVGQLELDAAHFHVGHIELEVHRHRAGHPATLGQELGSGGGADDGPGHDAGDDHGGAGGSGAGGDDDSVDELADEVELPGPFSFELIGGGAVLDQVSVFPGTFDRVDLRYVLADEAPFAGASIVIEGVFVTDDGSTPFVLRSAFVGRTHVPIAGGGIVVTENSVVPVELGFDLAAMLGSLDFASAVVDGGEILVDATHNPALLAAFEAGLSVRPCVGAHERDR